MTNDAFNRDANNDINNSADDIRNEAGDIKDAARDAADDVKDGARDIADEAREAFDGEGAEIRGNLREAGDALLSAGAALGAALGKFVEGLPDRFAGTADKARETLNTATTEGEVSSVATNFTNEAEKVFNSFRDRDLKFTEDAKQSVMGAINDIRDNFNKRLDDADTEGAEGVFADVRERFDGLVERIQEQFSAVKEDVEDAVAEARSTDVREHDVIDGEVIEDTDTTK